MKKTNPNKANFKRGTYAAEWSEIIPDFLGSALDNSSEICSWVNTVACAEQVERPADGFDVLIWPVLRRPDRTLLLLVLLVVPFAIAVLHINISVPTFIFYLCKT